MPSAPSCPAQIGEVVTDEIIKNTCDTLVEFDTADETKMVPKLAKSWDVSSDGKQITFHLQQGLTFPSGAKASAADMAWSLRRVAKLGLGNAATVTEYGFTKDNVDAMITAPDDETLVMRLDKPYPVSIILQAIAANRVASLLDRQTLLKNEVNGDMGNKHLATRTECVGPYKLARWNAGEVVVLQANSSYWGEKPPLKQIVISHVAEANTQRLLLEKGDIDVARDLVPEDLNDLAKNPDVSVQRVLKPQLFYWNINNADPILANEKVRLAMRYLIDYDDLAKTVMTNIGAVGALDEKEGQPFTLDTVKAKQLLTKAGYPDGFEMGLLIGTPSFSDALAQNVQANAAKVGIKLKIEHMANAQLFRRVRGREYQTTIQGWQTSIPDAHGNASRQIFNPDNRLEAKQTVYPSWRTGYYSEDANMKVNAALLEQDPDKRIKLYQDLQREMMQRGHRLSCSIFIMSQASVNP